MFALLVIAAGAGAELLTWAAGVATVAGAVKCVLETMETAARLRSARDERGD